VKFNFKKIASVIASTVMLSSTVALAAAANYPAPFVASGVSDVAVVYGASAAQTDLVAAVDITTNLQSKLTTVAATTGGSATVSGEAKAIETGSQKLYLGDYMNSTKTTFTSTELPKVLADGKITDTDGTSFTYNLKVNTPSTVVRYGRPSGVSSSENPFIYVDLTSSSQTFSQDIVFPTAVNVTKLADKDITLFGKKFTFTGATADLISTGTSRKVVLYENSNTKLVNSGETDIVVVGGTSYTIGVTSVESATEGTITVNGVSQKVTETNSYKVSGLDLYIKNVIGPNVAGETRAIEISAGAAKLTLEEGSTVTKGSNSVYGTSVAYTGSGGKVSKITVTDTPYSFDTPIKYLKAGDTITEPVFGAFKITFASYAPAVDDSSKNLITFKSTGENKASMKWTNKNSKTYDMDMFEAGSYYVTSEGIGNTTDANNATYSYNATTLAYDTYNIVTGTGAIRLNDYFITRNNEYSQIWRVDNYQPNTGEITVKDQGSGSTSTKVTFSNGTAGTVSLTLADGSSATLTLVGNGTSESTMNITASSTSPLLYTKGGALINLTRLANPILYNTTGASKIEFVEETSYNDGTFTDVAGATLGTAVTNFTLLWKTGQSGNDIKFSEPQVRGLVGAVPVGGSADTGTTVGDYSTYYLTRYGTFIKKTGNSNSDNSIDIYYPGTAANAGVYISELASAVTTAGGTTLVPIKDSEVATSTAKNLIVVGGSCINTAAADLLGSTTPLCGDEWEAKTGVGAGSFLIQTFARTGTGVATLVAGYNAEDTTNAGKYLTTQTVDTTVGKKYTGTTATSATLVTA